MFDPVLFCFGVSILLVFATVALRYRVHLLNKPVGSRLRIYTGPEPDSTSRGAIGPAGHTPVQSHAQNQGLRIYMGEDGLIDWTNCTHGPDYVKEIICHGCPGPDFTGCDGCA